MTSLESRATSLLFPIAEKVRSCLDGFRELSQNTLSPSIDDIGGISASEVSDATDRFRIWVGNIGAHRKDRGSLDYRLRDASHIQSGVLDLLNSLANKMEKACAILRGRRVPFERLSFESDSDSDSGLEVNERALDEGNDPSHGETELGQLMNGIKYSITDLLRISMVIRKPAAHDHFAHSNQVATSHFEAFDLRHIQDKFPKASKMVVERLARATSSRRNYLKYREDRQIDLSAGLEDLEGLDDPNLPPPSLIATSLNTVIKNSVHLDLDARSDAGATETSFASSFHGEHDHVLRLPRIPKAGRNGDPFQCPLCFGIISAKTENSWKKHVSKDLTPYVCTFDTCNIPFQRFDKRRDWFEHEMSHRSRWKCPQNCDKIFSTQLELSEHLKEHPGTFSDFSGACQVRPELSSCVFCPLCREEHRLSELQSHLGEHQQQLALFALPLQINNSEKDDGFDDDSEAPEEASVIETESDAKASEGGDAVEATEGNLSEVEGDSIQEVDKYDPKALPTAEPGSPAFVDVFPLEGHPDFSLPSRQSQPTRRDPAIMSLDSAMDEERREVMGLLEKTDASRIPNSREEQLVGDENGQQSKTDDRRTLSGDGSRRSRSATNRRDPYFEYVGTSNLYNHSPDSHSVEMPQRRVEYFRRSRSASTRPEPFFDHLEQDQYPWRLNQRKAKEAEQEVQDVMKAEEDEKVGPGRAIQTGQETEKGRLHVNRLHEGQRGEPANHFLESQLEARAPDAPPITPIFDPLACPYCDGVLIFDHLEPLLDHVRHDHRSQISGSGLVRGTTETKQLLRAEALHKAKLLFSIQSQEREYVARQNPNIVIDKRLDNMSTTLESHVPSPPDLFETIYGALGSDGRDNDSESPGRLPKDNHLPMSETAKKLTNAPQENPAHAFPTNSSSQTMSTHTNDASFPHESSPKSFFPDHDAPPRVGLIGENLTSQPPKGILRKPTEKFPEDPHPVREGVALKKDAQKGKDIPQDARWTKIDRRLVNPEALEEAKERYEERMDCVIVLRVLTKDEIHVLADRTRDIRQGREKKAPGEALEPKTSESEVAEDRALFDDEKSFKTINTKDKKAPNIESGESDTGMRHSWTGAGRDRRVSDPGTAVSRETKHLMIRVDDENEIDEAPANKSGEPAHFRNDENGGKRIIIVEDREKERNSLKEESDTTKTTIPIMDAEPGDFTKQEADESGKLLRKEEEPQLSPQEEVLVSELARKIRARLTLDDAAKIYTQLAKLPEEKRQILEKPGVDVLSLHCQNRAKSLFLNMKKQQMQTDQASAMELAYAPTDGAWREPDTPDQ
ncbi:hypothetical protein IWZ00DRAFT_484614 [Phyllosticta capitalensis]